MKSKSLKSKSTKGGSLPPLPAAGPNYPTAADTHSPMFFFEDVGGVFHGVSGFLWVVL